MSQFPHLPDYDPAHLDALPPNLAGGLRRYLEQGIPTGNGLRQVLENNDVMSVSAACDPVTWAFVPEILRALFTCAPTPAWGSPGNVSAWLITHGPQARPTT